MGRDSVIFTFLLIGFIGKLEGKERVHLIEVEADYDDAIEEIEDHKSHTKDEYELEQETPVKGGKEDEYGEKDKPASKDKNEKNAADGNGNDYCWGCYGYGGYGWG